MTGSSTPYMNSTPTLRMVWHAGDSWLAAAGGGRAARVRCSAAMEAYTS
jgi:hypothetical protein